MRSLPTKYDVVKKERSHIVNHHIQMTFAGVRKRDKAKYSRMDINMSTVRFTVLQVLQREKGSKELLGA